MKKHVTICADDYGQNLEISQAIIDLINLQKISATSCMVNSKNFNESAKLLIPVKDAVDIGLHFNLTEGYACSNKSHKFGSLASVLLKSRLGLLDKNFIKNELCAQLDVFEKTFKVLPDFIDGHQHVHHMPIIRDIVVEVYNERFQDSRTYIRCLDKNLVALKAISFKKLIIYLSGVKVFKKLLDKNNIPHNTSFSGVYDFVKSTDYAKYFNLFLQDINDGGLIMCHPGYQNINSENDSLHESRLNEVNFFKSDLYINLLEKHNVLISKYHT